MALKVVIIGSGVVGSALAAKLAPDAQVVLIDAGQPAGGTSGATFSWTNSNGKEPRTYHDFNVAGMLAHRRFADSVPGSDWFVQGGNIAWTNSAGALESLQAKVHALRERSYAAHWLTRRQALALEPSVDPGQMPDDGIALFPDEGWIYPARLIGALLRQAQAAGVQMVTEDPVTDLKGSDRVVREVHLQSGAVIHADAVVNCAGRDAGKIAGMAGVKLPMRNTQGVLTYLGPTAVDVRHVMHAPGIHLRPDGGGRLVLHTGEGDARAHRASDGRWDVEPGVAEEHYRAAAALYPGLKGAHVEDVRVGVRPIPADDRPVLGRILGLDNFYCAVTHSAATLCLHMADLVAPEVLGKGESPELAPYRQERLQGMDR